MKNKPKLLIIEDDLLTLKVYNRLFSGLFDIIGCASVTQYKECLEKNKIDLFIFDISLQSNIDGLQLIRALRKMDEYKNSTVVVVTAHVFMVDEQNARDAGADIFIRKPVDNKSLLEEITKCLPK